MQVFKEKPVFGNCTTKPITDNLKVSLYLTVFLCEIGKKGPGSDRKCDLFYTIKKSYLREIVNISFSPFIIGISEINFPTKKKLIFFPLFCDERR